MILAAAAYADDAKNEPPPELMLAFKAEQWGILPEAGGLRDQRIGELDRMTATLNTYRAMKSYRAVKPKDKSKWRKDNPQAWDLCESIRDLRIKDGEK